jgi:septal ring factor EnvC (AmiA/AmiB activator)
MMSFTEVITFIVGPGAILFAAVVMILSRRRDVTDSIDSKNIEAQQKYIATLEKEKIFLEGEIKVRDEQISNLKKQLEDQKSDFQRQIDTLTTQILEVKRNNQEISTIAQTLKMFIPLTEDVKRFHEADEKILAGLDKLIKHQGLADAGESA